MKRNRKPVELHVANGTYREDRHGPATVAPRDAYLSDLPAPEEIGHLTDVGLAEWERQGALMIEQRTLTKQDLILLFQYCQLFETIDQLQQVIQRQRALYDGELVLDDPEITKAMNQIRGVRTQLINVLKDMAVGPVARAAANVGQSPKFSKNVPTRNRTA